MTLACFMWLNAPRVWGAEPVVEVFTQNERLSSGGVGGEGGSSSGGGAGSGGISATTDSEKTKRHSSLPVLITFGVHAGYDSNSRTTANSSGSLFTDEQLTLAYDRTRGPMDLHILSGAGLVERFGLKTDINAFLDLSLTYLASRRLTLKLNIDPAYRAEPDFASDVGTTGRAGNYFTMNDGVSAAYQWSRRFSTVNSYSLRIIRFEDSFIAALTDREEHTFAEEFRFDLFRRTALVGDYRFLVVNYDSFPRDSITHFALAGAEQSFSSRLKAQLRAGASFRSIEQAEYQVNPDFEGSLDYALGRDSSLSLTTRYSVEEAAAGLQSSVSGSTLGRTTFRTGLLFHYSFTSKISSSIGLNYHHDDNQSVTPVTGDTVIPPTPALSTDAYEFLLSLRYQISRHIDFDIGFQHTEVNTSGQAQQNLFGQALQYSRNRYSLGLNFSF
ncbi:MAG: hypothetical protein H0X34_18430 [Chthoniobacterales bacterium]|nr:hypothetical protein [Chthoniobacterales bacterium]